MLIETLCHEPKLDTSVELALKPGVFITVDVECSMGGAWIDPNVNPVPPLRGIMGQFGYRQLGLPLIVQTLCEHSLAGTFFIEAFNEDLGYDGQTQPICEMLMDRGQDVQLHIHPNHRHFALHRKGLPFIFTDYIADLPSAAQSPLLEEGCRRLEQWTGRPPVAFRAGNYGADEHVLKQLASFGIVIDSSYSFPFAGRHCRFSRNDPFNGSRWYGNVLELALSGFYQSRLLGQPKPLDLVGVSFAELQDAILRINQAGADAVVILHSFSLFKVRNEQYDGGKPDRIVINRFRRLCEWLGRMRDTVPTYTCAELAAAMAQGRYKARSVAPCTLPAMRAVFSKAVQVYNRFYWT